MVSTPSEISCTQPVFEVETLNDFTTINAIDNIDAEYEALCANYSLISA